MSLRPTSTPTLLLALLWWCPAARGQEGAASPAVTAARGHFQAGRVYFEQGDLPRALEEFKQAARDYDRPELHYNIARTYDRMGDAARALEAYQRYLGR